MVQGTISVIIPAHNAAGTLVRCLRAVTGQDDADYEVIVIDDGSSDATSAVIGKFDVVHQHDDRLNEARVAHVAQQRVERALENHLEHMV